MRAQPLTLTRQEALAGALAVCSLGTGLALAHDGLIDPQGLRGFAFACLALAGAALAMFGPIIRADMQ
jgi:hypothetical protein